MIIKIVVAGLILMAVFVLIILGISIYVLNRAKGSKLFQIVKRHIISDEDLDPIQDRIQTEENKIMDHTDKLIKDN